VTLPVNRTVAAGRWVELKLTVNQTTGTGGLFAYGTTFYDSWLKLP
jgi:hypothetical protein